VTARKITVIFATFWNAIGIGTDEEVGPLGVGDDGVGAAAVGRGETVGDHETVGAHVAVGRPVTVGGSVPVGNAVPVGRCVPVGLHVIVGLHETVGGSVTDGEGLPFAGTAEGTSVAAWRSRRSRKPASSSRYPSFAASTAAKITDTTMRARLAVSRAIVDEGAERCRSSVACR
jgi:hypothetical protein